MNDQQQVIPNARHPGSALERWLVLIGELQAARRSDASRLRLAVGLALAGWFVAVGEFVVLVVR